jgi:cytochrome P450
MTNLRQNVETIDLQSSEFKSYPEKTWQRLHERGAIVTTRIPLLGRVALTTRYAESSIVLRDTERFTLDGQQVGHKQSAGLRWWVPGLLKPLANNLLTLEGDDHRSLRQRVDYAFRRVRLEQLQHGIDQIAQQCVDEFSHQLHRYGQADFVATISRPMPQQIISRLLGFNTDRGNTDSALNHALSRLGSVHGALDLFRTLPAIRTITRKLREEITSRRLNPREDLLSELIGTQGDGRPLTEDELLAMVFLLYVAGHETTTHLLSLSLWTLLNGSVSQAQKLLPLTDKSVAELLRYTSPVQMTKPRFSIQDQQLGNAFIKRGETVAALIGAVNRDADWIQNPNELNPGRSPVRHLGFGAGAHVCLGMHLAILETRILINAFLMQHPTVALHPSTAVTWNRRIGLRAMESMILVK